MIIYHRYFCLQKPMEALKDFYEKNQMVVIGCVVALLVLVLVLWTKSEQLWLPTLRQQPTFAVPHVPWKSENLALSIPGSAQLDPRFYGSTENLSVLDSALKGGEDFSVLDSALKGGEDMSVDPSETRRTPVLSGQLNKTRMTSSGSTGVLNVHRDDNSRRSRRSASNSSRPAVRQENDNDSLATEHMLSRGGAERAIMDASRNRYQGMAKIGADDYEGYVYEGAGHVYSDEQGELTATVYGINESPW